MTSLYTTLTLLLLVAEPLVTTPDAEPEFPNSVLDVTYVGPESPFDLNVKLLDGIVAPSIEYVRSWSLLTVRCQALFAVMPKDKVFSKVCPGPMFPKSIALLAPVVPPVMLRLPPDSTLTLGTTEAVHCPEALDVPSSKRTITTTKTSITPSTRDGLTNPTLIYHHPFLVRYSVTRIVSDSLDSERDYTRKLCIMQEAI